MKTRIAKKPLAKLAIPKDMKARTLKKFRTKDRTLLVAVMSAGTDAFAVVRFARTAAPETVRTFDTTGQSEITTDVRTMVAREMAIWFARHIALHNMTLPSAKKERSRRRSVIKKSVAKHQLQSGTKSALRAVTHPTTKPKGRVVGKLNSAYVFIYDPKSRPEKKSQPTTFVIHSATCPNLDGRRRSVRNRGASWLLEAHSPEEAVREQMREFDEEDKGYDRSDFTIHQCDLARKEIPQTPPTVIIGRRRK